MASTNGYAGDAGRVALYMRVSGEEQARRESIETQAEFLDSYCKLYGYEMAGIYKDEAISGTAALYERPAGRELLEGAKAGRFDTVLLYKLDRLGRTLLNVVDAHDRLMEAGVALRSATEPIDTSTPAGRLIFQMLASFAEFERATITERARDGLHRAVRNGKQPGRIPYGYDIAEDGSFVVVEEEAEIVRSIFRNFADGSTLYGEAVRLNEEHIPSPGHKFRGRPRLYGQSWSPPTVRRLLRQSAYSGTHTVQADSGPIERKVPAIVLPELQQKALARLEENRRYQNREGHRRYLLRGLITCDNCGVVYVGFPHLSDRRRYRHYKYGCSNRRKRHDQRAKQLNCPKVDARWLEEEVWQDIRSFVADPGEVLDRVRQQMEEPSRAGDLEERRASLTKRLASAQAEKGRYVKLYAQGRLDEAELETHLVDLKNRMDNLKMLIESVEADLAREEQNRTQTKSAAAWLMALRGRLEELEANTDEAWHERRELVKTLVERITVSRGEDGKAKAQILYKFSPPVHNPAPGVNNSW
jgi:site-specific DNA recombinase